MGQDPFSKWWVAEFGRPPLSSESKMFEMCRKAFESGRDDPQTLTYDEKIEELKEASGVYDADEDDEEAKILVYNGYEGALVGYSMRFGREPIALYDYDKCIEILMTPGEGSFEEGLSHEDAMEWFIFNTIGTWAGEKTPAFMKRFGTLL